MEEEKIEELGKEEQDDNEPVFSIGIKKFMTYYGILYFEEDGEEDLLFIFTAARKLNALYEFIKKEHSHAQMRQNFSFCFKDNDGYIELKFDVPQEKPITGWNIQPHIKPTKLNRFDVNNFGELGYPIPPYCLISAYKSTNAVPTLHYAIPLEGVTDPVTLYIHRSSKNPSSSVNASISSSVSTATAATEASPRNEGGGVGVGIDVKDVCKKLKKVLINHHVVLSEIFQYSLVSIANELLQVGIITREVQKTSTYDSMVGSFTSGLSLYHNHSELEEHCIRFLKALSNVGGPVNQAAYMIQKEWAKALDSALLFEF
ncbi:PREDICTED: uncharacterized protein LOC109586131 [Amphimedon queenslandica]|nr:PREDICTED: uncharacterized protein LOC109586131 [Amphimedon queenslandica]|eukprot:XP_019857860.1 PREDICTED: uncharacterized protein LOC109586131 [Amphimedon queenslandica]